MGGNRERHVVLVGGGHCHVHVLEALAESPPPGCRLTLVVDTPIAVYSGMVPGFIAGQYRKEELEIDVAALARRAGTQVVVGQAVRIDPQRQKIELDDGQSVSYDIASFDIGSIVAGLDLPGVREHAIPTRPIGVFIQRISEVIDSAQRCDRGRPFRVVVAGGGAAGVELAFALDKRLKEVSAANVAVTVLDSGPRILRSYPDSLVRRASRRMEQRCVEIRCNHTVAAVEPNCLDLERGDPIPYDALVWTTGSASQRIFNASGLATDSRRFVRVRSTLQFEEHDNLFGTGDCATLIDYPNTAKAGVYAVRQGPFVARNLKAMLTGTPLRSYKPQSDFLSLLNLGDGTALGAKHGFTIEGRWVMKLKDWLDRSFVRRYQ